MLRAGTQRQPRPTQTTYYSLVFEGWCFVQVDVIGPLSRTIVAVPELSAGERSSCWHLYGGALGFAKGTTEHFNPLQHSTAGVDLPRFAVFRSHNSQVVRRGVIITTRAPIGWDFVWSFVVCSFVPFSVCYICPRGFLCCLVYAHSCPHYTAPGRHSALPGV